MTETKREYNRKPVTVKSLLEKGKLELSATDDVPSLGEVDVAVNIVRRFNEANPVIAKAVFGELVELLTDSEG